MAKQGKAKRRTAKRRTTSDVERDDRLAIIAQELLDDPGAYAHMVPTHPGMRDILSRFVELLKEHRRGPTNRPREDTGALVANLIEAYRRFPKYRDRGARVKALRMVARTTGKTFCAVERAHSRFLARQKSGQI